MDNLKNLNPSGRQGASSTVVNAIQRAIQTGVIKVGDKLPNEAELAKELNVGRSSLREGMRILSAYGVVEIRQGEGTFVINRTAEQFFDFLGFMPNSSTFLDFVEMRRVIETGNIITIYNKLTPADFKELQGLIDQLEYSNGVNACIEADRAFHHYLLTYTRNSLMTQIDKLIYKMRSELLLMIMCHEEVVEDARAAHQKILEALIARDEARCIKCVGEHMDTTADYIHNIIKT